VKPPPAPAPRLAAAEPAPPPAPGRRAGPERAAISTGQPQGPEVAPPSGPPAHSALMTMRQPPRPDLKGPSSDFLDHFLANSKPLARPDNPSAAIAADIDHDRADLGNPKWVANASPDELAAARQHLSDSLDAAGGEELHPSGHGTYKTDHDPMHSPFNATVNADGTVSLKDTPDVGDFHIPRWNIDGVNVPLPMIVGKMNFDDWLMHKKGIDPYAAAKLKWLDQTRDERVAIGRAHRKEVLAHAPEYMQQNLVWLWAQVKDPAKRRLALFELWDECAETGDDDLVKAGAAARAYVLGFVRTHLPAGSPDAFTVGELARLNAHRQSRAPFAPYADGATP
jgi:hypothetical protein